MSINNVMKIMVDFIESNKSKFGINYENSIETIQEILDEIKQDYKNLGDENKNEN